jgi:hypothetical protein
VPRTSFRTYLVRIPRPEILGGLAALAVSLLLGLVMIYLIALVHRSEERGALAEFAAIAEEGDNASLTAPARYSSILDVFAIPTSIAPACA